MNKQRRLEIDKVIDDLSLVRDNIEAIQGDENESFENLPESFQQGAKGEVITAAIEALESAYSAVQDAIAQLEEAKGVN